MKWARGVEHQQVLARATRERQQSGIPNRYERCDNAGDAADAFLRMHWHLADVEPVPERWGVLLGDVFANFRAALDHTMWAAVVQHSGLPGRPEAVQFPITREPGKMKNPRAKLRPLVAPAVWDLVEKVQPVHLDDPQRHELETLRWCSNVDKHRVLHATARSYVDAGPVVVRPDVGELELVDEWLAPGQVQIGDVVAGLTLRRSTESQGVDLGPTFAHTLVLQVGEEPPAWVPLADAMEAVKHYSFSMIVAFAELLGEELPDSSSFELGSEHAAVAREFGGRSLHWSAAPPHLPPYPES